MTTHPHSAVLLPRIDPATTTLTLGLHPLLSGSMGYAFMHVGALVDLFPPTAFSLRACSLSHALCLWIYPRAGFSILGSNAAFASLSVPWEPAPRCSRHLLPRQASENPSQITAPTEALSGPSRSLPAPSVSAPAYCHPPVRPCHLCDWLQSSCALGRLHAGPPDPAPAWPLPSERWPARCQAHILRSPLQGWQPEGQKGESGFAWHGTH